MLYAHVTAACHEGSFRELLPNDRSHDQLRLEGAKLTNGHTEQLQWTTHSRPYARKTDEFWREAALAGDNALLAGHGPKSAYHPARETGIWGSHAFFKLPYWSIHCHQPDAMHTLSNEVRYSSPAIHLEEPRHDVLSRIQQSDEPKHSVPCRCSQYSTLLRVEETHTSRRVNGMASSATNRSTTDGGRVRHLLHQHYRGHASKMALKLLMAA